MARMPNRSDKGGNLDMVAMYNGASLWMHSATLAGFAPAAVAPEKVGDAVKMNVTVTGAAGSMSNGDRRAPRRARARQRIGRRPVPVP